MSLAPSNLIRDIRSMPRPVWILVIGLFINRFGAFVFPFLTLILSQRHLDAVQISLVLGAMSVGFILGPIIGGYLADAIGRRNTIVFSLVGAAFSLVALYYCHEVPTIALTVMVHGCLGFLFGPACGALVTDLVPEKKRVTAFALLRLAVNGGFAAGPAVAGLLFMYAPALVFFGDAFTTLVFALIAWRWLPHGLRSISGKVTSPGVVWRSWRDTLADMRENFPFLQFLLAIIFVGIALNQVINVLVLTTTNQGLSPADYGQIMAVNGILIVTLELYLSNWVNRFNVRRVLAFGYSLMGIGCGLFGLMHSYKGFILAMVVFTLGEILALPLGTAYSSNLVPEALRGRYFGIRNMAWAVASLIGSLGVWIYGLIGAWLWLGVAACAFLATTSILPALQDRRNPEVLPARRKLI